MMSVGKLFDGCVSLSTPQKFNLLRGVVKILQEGSDPRGDVAPASGVMTLWLADLLLYDKALPNFDSIYLSLDYLYGDIIESANMVLACYSPEKKMFVKKAPIFRIEIIDSKYARWNFGQRPPIDIETGLPAEPYYSDLKIVSYNSTALFIRRALLVFSEAERVRNSPGPVPETASVLDGGGS